jgi:hypothetical protein
MVPLVPLGTYVLAILVVPALGISARKRPIQSLWEWVLGACQDTVIRPPGATVVGETTSAGAAFCARACPLGMTKIRLIEKAREVKIFNSPFMGSSSWIW